MDLSQLAIEPPESEGYPFALPTTPPCQIRLRSPQSAEVVSAIKAAEIMTISAMRETESPVEKYIGDSAVARDVYMAAAAIIDFGGMKIEGEEITTEQAARKAFAGNNGGRMAAMMIARELERIERDFRKASKVLSDGRGTSDTSTPPPSGEKKAV